jgi:hypothetical protein
MNSSILFVSIRVVQLGKILQTMQWGGSHTADSPIANLAQQLLALRATTRLTVLVNLATFLAFGFIAFAVFATGALVGFATLRCAGFAASVFRLAMARFVRARACEAKSKNTKDEAECHSFNHDFLLIQVIDRRVGARLRRVTIGRQDERRSAS